MSNSSERVFGFQQVDEPPSESKSDLVVINQTLIGLSVLSVGIVLSVVVGFGFLLGFSIGKM